MTSRVAAIIVTYEPDATLAAQVRALARQVTWITIFDNGSSPQGAAILRELPASVEVHALGHNLGIGAAHNRGVLRARELGATHVLLMDQDSVPEDDMVAKLLAAEQAMSSARRKVGAVGPAYRDTSLGRTWPFYRLSTFGVRGEQCRPGVIVPCDLLITSGMLVRLDVMAAVGPLNEEFFLEHVDTEWSLRARHFGLQLFGVCDAGMEHALGDASAGVPFTRRRVQIYAPYRYYYLFRNAVLLWRSRSAPLPWKIHEARRLLARVVFLALFVPPRVRRLRFMALGLWHGLRGRTGPFQPTTTMTADRVIR
jgi:rhamnosyltransferase